MTKTKGTKLASKPWPQIAIGQYEVVATPEARERVESKGNEVLDAIRLQAVDEPRVLVLERCKVRGRSTVLVAFLNPYVRTAYIDFLDEERLDSDELTREKSKKTVALGIGARPDLPPGDQYVREIWRGLATRE